jgi:alpha,alpha-trehalose-phosphate synthase [UDP-forming]
LLLPIDPPAHGHEIVVVANRLPIDVNLGPDGEVTWDRSPGGLVTALGPVMTDADAAWVGWCGAPDLVLEPLVSDDMQLVPVTLSAAEIELYYEGFSNDTLWPLYHDVIVAPSFHRSWWDSYRQVNAKFAAVTAAQAAAGATVWVHDYQLQLVPAMLRELRPDLRIGFFLHIPFPAIELFAQLPWRRELVQGLLGADLIGFQRAGGAANFLRAVRTYTGAVTRRSASRGWVVPGVRSPDGPRTARVGHFPISIDSTRFDELARSQEVQQRAAELRAELGHPRVVLLGVDRLDYTKGIRHRLQAYGELLEEGRLSADTTTLVQVATPSREKVGAYAQLRDEVELAVGRLNGDFSTMGHAPVQYLHQSFDEAEMAALYLSADVMLVTALRDGMNLVAKEYVAACSDETGVLVLSEFTGAADELTSALLVNPHDIDGLKDAIMSAVEMDERHVRRRMRKLRRRVLQHDVQAWSAQFLEMLASPVDG